MLEPIQRDFARLRRLTPTTPAIRPIGIPLVGSDLQQILDARSRGQGVGEYVWVVFVDGQMWSWGGGTLRVAERTAVSRGQDAVSQFNPGARIDPWVFRMGLAQQLGNFR